MRRLLCFIFLLCTAFSPAYPERDSIITSLVTCSPGKAVYEVYGHTAIRICNTATGREIVYNYGLFDFNSPHFLFRWLKGETDYIVDSQDWDIFEYEYLQRGSTIYIQDLNFTQDEHHRLAELLFEHSKPENRTYRYDFLSRNCATMALDKIEEATGRCICYTQSDPLPARSFRDILHKYNGIEPWNSFGVDLVTGAETDTVIRTRQASFAPLELKRLVELATLADTAGTDALVLGTVKLVPKNPVRFNQPLIDPFQAMVLLFLCVLLTAGLEWNAGRHFITADIVIFGMQGLAGTVIGFLYFFSSHPSTDSNWLILCLNPIPLVCLPFLVRNIRRKRTDIFLLYEFVTLTLFLIFHKHIPQEMNDATLMMLAVFALRSLCGILHQIRTGARPGHHGRKAAQAAAVALMLLPASGFSRTTAAVPSRNCPESPDLVVGIVIDQLNGAYLERMMPLFGEDGFKKLYREGHRFPDVHFEYDCRDRASATASIYSGTFPFYHGITGERWIDRKSLMFTGAVDDSNESGINTIERCSPAHLQVLTLSDEMKIASHGKSLICSVSPERDIAVLAGGHEADAVLWMNNSDGSWCTSTYYGSFPSWANEINSRPWKKQEWKPELPVSEYIQNQFSPLKSFVHSFGRGDVWSYKTAPLANDMATEMALASFKELKLGQSGAPDLLAISLYAGGFDRSPARISSIELQDTYLKLDRNIAQIITTIETAIGSDKVLFFVTSTGYDISQDQDISELRMPSNTISMQRVTALLNLYLSALYQQGEYINAFNGTELYLDHEMLDRYNISSQEISVRCADFLMQVAGVKNVTTQRDLIYGSPSGTATERHNSFNYTTSGDIIVEVSPGWKISDESNGTAVPQRTAMHSFPVFMYGSRIRPGVSAGRMGASFIASTLSWLLDIEVPSACTAFPFTGIIETEDGVRQ